MQTDATCRALGPSQIAGNFRTLFGNYWRPDYSRQPSLRNTRVQKARKALRQHILALMETLAAIPFDLVFDQLSLREALQASYVSHSWHTLLLPYLQSRYCISRYLDCFPDSKSALKIMRETNTVLSGSRALAYFVPSIRRHVQSSDWDFYVPESNRELVHQELLSQGYSLIKEKAATEQFTVVNYHNETGTKLQLVCLKPFWTFPACLKNFHSSIVQNVISGFGCYSVYWKTTFNMEGWFGEKMERVDYEEYRAAQAQKFAERGFRMVRWPDRNAEAGQGRHIFAAYWRRKGNSDIMEDLYRDEFEMDLTVGAYLQEDYIRFRRHN